MPIRRWTTTKVINEILSFPTDKRYSSYIKKHREELWKAGVRYFGSWQQAIKACGLDYEDIVRYGPRGSPSNKTNRKCSESACNRKHHAKGLCHIHYNIDRRSSLSETYL